MPVKTHKITEVLGDHVPAGEDLHHFAYGVRPPGILTLLCVALTGPLAPLLYNFLGKHFFIGATESRLILAFVRPFGWTVKDVLTVPMEDVGEVECEGGSVFVRLRFAIGDRRFRMKFHRMGAEANHASALSIAQGLGRAPAAASGAQPSVAVSPPAPHQKPAATLRRSTNFGLVGLWMAATAVAAPMVSDLLAFGVLYLEWGSLTLVRVAIVAIGAVVVSKLLTSAIPSSMMRGFIVGASTWVVATLIAVFAFWGDWQLGIEVLSSNPGVIQIAVCAISGALAMALLQRTRVETPALP